MFLYVFPCYFIFFILKTLLKDFYYEHDVYSLLIHFFFSYSLLRVQLANQSFLFVLFLVLWGAKLPLSYNICRLVLFLVPVGRH